ncbi:MAG: 1,4-dihydroxy-2-naphthoate polyprenyltransferase [Pseudomonadota bacterium]|nr:1,4-dihydroxy-2-naphthoate polyprenyltransferase [Pseudomonadota bacterium]
MTRISKWLLAIRPKTLAISIAPVLAGTSLAWAETSQIHWLIAFAALMGALFIQIGTNLHNDAADFERGADCVDRIGPARATAQGWFTASQVKAAAYLSFSVAFIIGIYLVWVGGWPILILGLLSLFAGYSYTGGNKPIAYRASGELFAFLFFGLAAVLGSYYIQTLKLSLNALILAIAIGLLAAAVLLVNNYRDLETDRKVGKLTLTYYLGRNRSKMFYLALMVSPFLLPAIAELPLPGNWFYLLALPFSLLLVYKFFTATPGPVFNTILARTAQLQLFYSILISIGLLL